MTTPHVFTSDPIFMGGENRSGTTLLSLLLDSHPALAIGPELDFLKPRDLGSHILECCDLLIAKDPRVLGPGTDTADPDWYHGSHFVKQCQRFGIAFEELRELIQGSMAALRRPISRFEDRCFVIEQIGEYRRSRQGARRWGIKLQRKIPRVDEFANIWPGAHFVHIVRDGRDLAASHLRTVTWGYSTIEEAARGWLEVVERPSRVAPPDRYIEIRYEDLVSHPREVLGRVMRFVGMPWDDALLRHSEQSHTLFDHPWGHPAAEAAAKPLSADRIGRFRDDLTSSEVERFERIAGRQLVAFGYELESGHTHLGRSGAVERPSGVGRPVV